MLEKNIQAHFNSNLAKATVHQLPFQYLFYENVFPLNFYNDLIGSLPKFPVYDPYAKGRPGGNEFPDRFINAGVAEQNMTGIAAGMASEGYHVFTYSIANFPLFQPDQSFI